MKKLLPGVATSAMEKLARDPSGASAKDLTALIPCWNILLLTQIHQIHWGGSLFIEAKDYRLQLILNVGLNPILSTLTLPRKLDSRRETRLNNGTN